MDNNIKDLLKYFMEINLVKYFDKKKMGIIN